MTFSEIFFFDVNTTQNIKVVWNYFLVYISYHRGVGIFYYLIYINFKKIKNKNKIKYSIYKILYNIEKIHTTIVSDVKDF